MGKSNEKKLQQPPRSVVFNWKAIAGLATIEASATLPNAIFVVFKRFMGLIPLYYLSNIG